MVPRHHSNRYFVFFLWYLGSANRTFSGMLQLRRSFTKEEIEARYKEFYHNEPLMRITNEIPEVRDCFKKHYVTIGAFECDAKTRRVVTVTTLDNLLKGAATQAVQNMNIALNIEDELAGIRKEL